MTQITYPTSIHKAVDDASVIAQLPSNIIEALGSIQETGYQLMLNRRDLYFDKGVVQYSIGSKEAVVTLEED